jgi:hypothetical protein
MELRLSSSYMPSWCAQGTRMTFQPPAHIHIHDYTFIHIIIRHIENLYRTSTLGENNSSFRIREVTGSSQNGDRQPDLGTS